MRRGEAIDILREISKKCGSEITVDIVSLMPHKEPVMPFSNSPEMNFRLYLQASLSNMGEDIIKSILQERGLQMTSAGNFLIIY